MSIIEEPDDRGWGRAVTGRERQQQIESDALFAISRKFTLMEEERDALAARLSGLQDTLAAKDEALRQVRTLFVDLRGDWSDNRGPCREGIAVIDAALALNTDGEATE